MSLSAQFPRAPVVCHPPGHFHCPAVRLPPPRPRAASTPPPSRVTGASNPINGAALHLPHGPSPSLHFCSQQRRPERAPTMTQAPRQAQKALRGPCLSPPPREQDLGLSGERSAAPWAPARKTDTEQKRETDLVLTRHRKARVLWNCWGGGRFPLQSGSLQRWR